MKKLAGCFERADEVLFVRLGHGQRVQAITNHIVDFSPSRVFELFENKGLERPSDELLQRLEKTFSCKRMTEFVFHLTTKLMSDTLVPRPNCPDVDNESNRKKLANLLEL